MGPEGLQRVLVVGSFSQGQNREHRESFERTCKELGSAIAQRGCTLIIGSLALETADPHALNGYLEGGGQYPVFVRPSNEIHGDMAQRWRELTAGRSGAHLDELPPGTDNGLWRILTVRRADGVVLVGGRQGTNDVRHLCQRLATCFVGLPQFKGPGAEAFSDVQKLLNASGLESLGAHLSALSSSPGAALDILAQMRRERTRVFPDTVVPRDAEPHVYEALVLAAGEVDGHPVTAGPVLRAILDVQKGGTAFGVLREMLSKLGLPVTSGRDRKHLAQPSAVTLAPEFMESLRVAWSAVPTRDKIWGRTLVTAALFDQAIAADPQYESVVGELRAGWQTFVLRDTEHRHRATTLEAFRLLVDRRGPSTGTTEPVSSTGFATALRAIGVAAPGNDDPWNGDLEDKLGVGAEAKAFARLAAARLFKPPIAVGVFGDWGAGKSFFMRLVHEHVERLSRGAASRSEQAPEAGDDIFHTDIVQVRFNAWHYAETNLWASLVDHLFTELDRWLRLRQAPGGAGPLLEQLSTARELTLNAAEELVRRRKEQRSATARLQEAERALEQVRGPAGRSPRVLWAALRAAVSGHPELADLEEQFKKAAKELGLYDAQREAESLDAAARALETELTRGEVVRANLIKRLQSPLLVALFVSVCLLAPLGLSLLRGALTEHWPRLAALHEGVLEFSAILASGAGLLGGVAARVRGTVTRLERAKSGLDQAIEKELEQPTGDLKQKQDELQKLTAQAEEARARLSTSTDRLAEATREYASGTGSGRLLEFIRARATDGQYARHLGLIATIRKDFEELATNLQGASQAAQEELKRSFGTFKSRIDALIQSNQELLNAEEQERLRSSSVHRAPPVTFQRIILYIDDLDRCPPSKVVDVLQALHLLLTFPLFVVFVAVDVRWVSRSLERQYGDLLDPANRDQIAGPAATARDYLEKIFQIPYWVRPMGEQGSRDFIEDRVREQVASLLGENPVMTVKGTAFDTFPVLTPGRTEEASKHSPVADALGSVAATDHSGSAPAQPNARSAAAAPPVLQPLDARLLSLSKEERECLRMLAPYLGNSPRRALRFLNVYRVVKASLPESELDTLQLGGYRALMTQLAIATGAPSLLQTWLGTLVNATPGTPLSSLLESVRASKGQHQAREMVQIEGTLAYYAATPDVEKLHHYEGIVRRYSFSG